MMRVFGLANLVLCALAAACASGESPEGSGFSGGFSASSPMTSTPATSSASTTDAGTSDDTGTSSGAGSTATTDDASTTGAITDGTTEPATSTTGTSSTTDTSGGTTGECPTGELDCPCYGNNTCNDDLLCEGGVCVPPPAIVCGDGMIGGNEECDDGDANADTAACKSDCTTQKCGDGFLGPDEACDDGNAVDNDACTNACVVTFCGDGVVQMGEACDDGNDVNTDACINCQNASCGDGFVQAGVEQCDDGNGAGGDGCSATCQHECGGKFTTSWCPQVGTNQQFTRCESVSNNNKTCHNPFIKYGTVENGVPAQHNGNNFNTWCVQLGFAGFSGQVSYGSRSCIAPQGRLFGCTGYDEPGWHWCDWQDGTWLNQTLNYHICNMGDEILAITCQ